MKRKERLPELLAPAGSYEAMLAAVEGGADAVYLGGKAFGARAFADNFDLAALSETVRYCHLYGVRVYVTVNTLLYDRELSAALDFCRDLSDIGADAVISADLGLISLIRRFLPQLPVHASTQMSVHSLSGAQTAADLGAERVVLARELSLADISYITERCRAEVEIFLHGALCVCYSGQCLFSSMVGGRSGNRGACAQPCRLPYNGQNNYPLSLRDLSLARYIPELIRSGVSSLKIEGRMKSPSYVYGVTSVYRRLLDEERAATDAEEKYLSDLFSRGGFTDGYFVGHPERPMTGVRSAADKERTKQTEERTFSPLRHAVRAEVTVRRGAPSRLTLTDGEKSVTVTGDIPLPAQNAPLDPPRLASRLSKMGNTFLSLPAEDVCVHLDDGLYLSPGAVNALRRAAAEAFCFTGRTAAAAVTVPSLPPVAAQKKRTAQFLSADTYRALDAETKAFFDTVFLPVTDGTDLCGATGVYLPPVIKDGAEADDICEKTADAARRGAVYALVGNIGQIQTAVAAGLVPVGDFRLNICNRHTAEVYRKMGVSDLILSPELTLPMIRDIGGGTLVYGRVSLMITERCFAIENGGCRRCGHVSLVDRIGKKFPILREYPHRSLILNAVPTYMGDRTDDLRRYGVLWEHFLFTTESPAEVRDVVRAWKCGLPLSAKVRRVGK